MKSRRATFACLYDSRRGARSDKARPVRTPPIEQKTYPARGLHRRLNHAPCDLKRGEYSPRRTEMRIGRLTDRPQSISILSKSVAPVA